MPIKNPLVVEDPEGAFRKFEDLTRRLIAVPKTELNAKLARYEKQKLKRKRLRENGHA